MTALQIGTEVARMNMIAAISGENLVNALIWLVIGGAIYGLLLWLIGKAPLPEPFKPYCIFFAALIAVVFLINALLTVVGKPFISW